MNARRSSGSDSIASSTSSSNSSTRLRRLSAHGTRLKGDQALEERPAAQEEGARRSARAADARPPRRSPSCLRPAWTYAQRRSSPGSGDGATFVTVIARAVLLDLVADGRASPSRSRELVAARLPEKTSSPSGAILASRGVARQGDVTVVPASVRSTVDAAAQRPRALLELLGDARARSRCPSSATRERGAAVVRCRATRDRDRGSARGRPPARAPRGSAGRRSPAPARRAPRPARPRPRP